MRINTEHICFKIIALTLVIAIITPALVKFSHGFQNHEHEVCYGESTSHLHELDIDCDFYKFKLNTQYVHLLKPINVLEIEQVRLEIKSQYTFISDYQRLQTSLRGPPTSV
ncbi:hypothetical protein [uncultured Winogradskyella sp.]|uniref:hypothetical protein n=1 Tax=uncultured Winogradskyella sp. TaxID=395353 RepID=UPI0026118DA7|nr:hypothetical protein [uncultured Winogradskyella sp.]